MVSVTKDISELLLVQGCTSRAFVAFRGKPNHATIYCSFAYSALACFRMGMSGSASFQRFVGK